MNDRLGRYELVTKLATGGMADVFVARQWGDGGFVRPVVVKRMHAHLAEDPAQLAHFEAEATTLSQLRHPAVPYIVDFRCEGGVWFIAMQLAVGPTLQEVRDVETTLGRRMPWKVALTIACQLADALGHVHDCHSDMGKHLELVHGDLSPSNLVLGHEGRVTLIDFGITTTAEQRAAGSSGAIRGTNGYMAPEQVSGRGGLDGRADLFAVGVLLWECTVGERLYPPNDLAFLEAVTRHDAPAPIDKVEGYPAALSAIVQRALARDPAARYASCQELRWALDQFGRENDVPLGTRALADYVEALFPQREEPSYNPEAPVAPPDSVDRLPMPVARSSGLGLFANTDEDFDSQLPANLSEAERLDMLGDLDVFSDDFDDLTPPALPVIEGMDDIEVHLGDSRIDSAHPLPRPPATATRGAHLHITPAGKPNPQDEDSGVYMHVAGKEE